MTKFSPGPSGYWTQALYTSINAVAYALSFGRFLFLEGRRRGGTWHNWTHGERSAPDSYLSPTTEDEIKTLIRDNENVRVVGAGHSFNAGVSSPAMLSLDAYTGVIPNIQHPASVPKGPNETFVRVRAGMRVRDLNRELRNRGLAIVALPSHDAQSVAGILSTDVHGTGRDVGFVSASVVGLRVIDGRGNASDVWLGDDLFAAAIGGIGAVGVITEVTLRCIDRFRVRQATSRIQLEEARRDWRRLLDEHDHASFYVFPFAEHVQFHTWDRTDSRKSFACGLREFGSITRAALSAAWLGDLIAWSKLLPRVADLTLRAQSNSELVMDSASAFNRTIYHMHQELEFAVPIERTWEVCDHVIDLYEQQYRSRRMPFTLIELRFTPAKGTPCMISPGAGDRENVYVNVVCNQSGNFAGYYEEVEAYMREIDAKPHLGKWCETITHVEMANLHGGAFQTFTQLRDEHDPDRKFANAFTDRVFGP